MTKTKAELEQDLVDSESWLQATKDALDSVTVERDELKARVAALEEQLRLAGAGEFEQAGDDNSYSEEDDGGTVH